MSTSLHKREKGGTYLFTIYFDNEIIHIFISFENILHSFRNGPKNPTFFPQNQLQTTALKSVSQTRKITMRQRPVASNNVMQESQQLLREFTWESVGLIFTNTNANVLAETPGI